MLRCILNVFCIERKQDNVIFKGGGKEKEKIESFSDTFWLYVASINITNIFIRYGDTLEKKNYIFLYS